MYIVCLNFLKFGFKQSLILKQILNTLKKTNSKTNEHIWGAYLSN